jgi:hypothetical protein
VLGCSPLKPARVAASVASFAALAPSVGCVPEGPPTTETRAAPAKPVAAPRHTRREARAPSRPPITAPFQDTFDRAELGADWTTLSPAWKIRDGRLCARGARNKGAWLARSLPTNARIEFEAYAESAEGDLKVELWGDGVSGATSTSYTNATSYVAILGGWRNKKHVLARLDEHGADRLEIDVDPDSDDENKRAVAEGQAYHFKVERSDGKTVRVSVNGASYFELADREPLAGAGHEHFGFNDWNAPVCFDNLKVTPL